MSVKDGDEVFDQPEITEDKPSLVNQSDEATADPEYPQPDEKPVQVYNWPVQCRHLIAYSNSPPRSFSAPFRFPICFCFVLLFV